MGLEIMSHHPSILYWSFRVNGRGWSAHDLYQPVCTFH